MFYLSFCYNAHVHVAETVQQRPLGHTFRWVAEFGVTSETIATPVNKPREAQSL